VACHDGPVIELRGLTKVFGKNRAVDNLTCSIEPGVVTGFLGPNGAGKSTTMRMILGLDRPTAGTATLDGRTYHELGHPLRTIGALLEAKQTHPNRSARNHLRWVAAGNRLPVKRVDEVLEMVGLTEVANKKTKTFSLGMAQRLGIAGAMLGDPPVLLFDEPVNGLDPEGIRWIRTLMRSFAEQGRTVFVSSHLLAEMGNTADHLIVIGRGKLIADTTMSEFIKQGRVETVRVRTPHADKFRDALTAAGMQVQVDGDGFLVHGAGTEQVGELAAQHAVTLHELSPQRASLEEAYMELTDEAVEYRAHGTPGVPS
jgi:ABC-2 type transport system ATP-binding protein